MVLGQFQGTGFHLSFRCMEVKLLDDALYVCGPPRSRINELSRQADNISS